MVYLDREPSHALTDLLYQRSLKRLRRDFSAANNPEMPDYERRRAQARIENNDGVVIVDDTPLLVKKQLVQLRPREYATVRTLPGLRERVIKVAGKKGEPEPGYGGWLMIPGHANSRNLGGITEAMAWEMGKENKVYAGAQMLSGVDNLAAQIVRILAAETDKGRGAWGYAIAQAAFLAMECSTRHIDFGVMAATHGIDAVIHHARDWSENGGVLGQNLRAVQAIDEEIERTARLPGEEFMGGIIGMMNEVREYPWVR